MPSARADLGARETMSEPVPDFLQRTDWFHGLEAPHRRLLLSSVTEVNVAAGECLARAGEDSRHWIGVVHGILKMYVTDADGGETTLFCLCEGEWGGEGSILKREPRRYNLVALTPSTVCMVPATTFWTLQAESLPFNQFLLSNMNKHMGVFVGILQATRLLRPEFRVAQCLLLLAGSKDSAEACIDIRQHDLAQMSGLSRQRTNAALGTLRRLNLVKVRPQGRLTMDPLAVQDFVAGHKNLPREPDAAAERAEPM